MFTCPACGSNDSEMELVEEVFTVKGKFLLVEKIPAEVCQDCGDPTYSRETTDKIERMVNGGAQPIRSIKLPVYRFE